MKNKDITFRQNCIWTAISTAHTLALKSINAGTLTLKSINTGSTECEHKIYCPDSLLLSMVEETLGGGELQYTIENHIHIEINPTIFG